MASSFGAARGRAAFRAFAAAALMAASGVQPLAAQSADSTRFKHVFASTDAYVVGGFTLALLAARPLDARVTAKMQQPAWQANKYAGRGSTVVRLLAVPGTLVGGAVAYGYGRATHDPTISRVALHSVEAVVVNGIVTNAGKVVAGRARPYKDVNNPHDFKLFRGWRNPDYQSFPSGHTSSAFAMAAALTAEAGVYHPKQRWIVGGVTYTLASLTGISRMYNNKHWASDVVAGAAIGTVTGLTVVRYNYIHRGNTVDRHLVPKNRTGIPIVISIPAP
ncbi:MAG TPA: phosphatase PAP2 family protein [Longimicrobiaceae bacterium]|jgi:membrane-associated phospholipid phosphatase|nr:phosphatase PAP2 family protein [Longimicrobiaceae bacterium]